MESSTQDTHSTNPSLTKSSTKKSPFDLRNSAVAKLLIEGTYPGYPQSSIGKLPKISANDPHTSVTSATSALPGGVKIKSEPLDYAEDVTQPSENYNLPTDYSRSNTRDVTNVNSGSSELSKRLLEVSAPNRSSDQTDGVGTESSETPADEQEELMWQCRYCTFRTGERSGMYRHIKMHLNLSKGTAIYTHTHDSNMNGF